MLVVVLKLLDQIAVKCVKAHFNVWQVTQRQIFNPTGDLTKLCNSCVLLLLEKAILIVELLASVPLILII